MEALVIGGTGPTGPHIVGGLAERGYEVTILHTGRHESPDIPAQVRHIHTDPFSADAVADALGAGEYDLALVMYGRLRVLAPLLAGRVGRFLSIGGVAAYAGFSEPRDLSPAGMVVPTPEDGATAAADEPLDKVRRIVETEAVVFDHHPGATHLRYPLLYGPRQLVPREWSIVRRCLDGRPFLIVPDGGLTLETVCYGENAATAVLCAVDRPEAAAGRVYNVGDSELLTLAQTAEVIADELGHRWELVSMPVELATPARPMLRHWSSRHRVVDTTRIRAELGYRDAVPPLEALARTARWLAEHPVPPGDRVERVLQDPFDYAAEDQLVAAWRRAMSELVPLAGASAAGYSGAYYGREPNPGGGRRVDAGGERG